MMLRLRDADQGDNSREQLLDGVDEMMGDAGDDAGENPRNLRPQPVEAAPHVDGWPAR
jgi:hypothetical protein